LNHIKIASKSQADIYVGVKWMNFPDSRLDGRRPRQHQDGYSLKIAQQGDKMVILPIHNFLAYYEF